MFADDPFDFTAKPKRKFRPNKDIDGSGFTNDVRADRALEALDAWAAGYKVDEDTYRDLLNDLMHLCDRDNLDFAKLLSMARRTYEDESGNRIEWITGDEDTQQKLRGLCSESLLTLGELPTTVRSMGIHNLIERLREALAKSKGGAK